MRAIGLRTQQAGSTTQDRFWNYSIGRRQGAGDEKTEVNSPRCLMGIDPVCRMTMAYSVDSLLLIKALKPGDKIRFTTDTPKRVITKVEKLKN
jgi:hypothetical protein